jgi:hypothetical protein
VQVQEGVSGTGTIESWCKGKRDYLVRVQLGVPGTGAAGYSGEGTGGIPDAEIDWGKIYLTVRIMLTFVHLTCKKQKRYCSLPLRRVHEIKHM